MRHEINYSILDEQEDEIINIEHNEKLRVFLEWNDKEILNKKTTQCVKFTGYLGFLLGAIGMYHTGVLGGRFGELVANIMKIDEEEYQKIFYAFFAVDTFLPMMALSSLATKNHFQNVVSYKNKKLKKKHNLCCSISLKSLAYIFAILASLTTPAYITYTVTDNFPEVAQFLICIPAFIGGFMFNIRAEERLVNGALRKVYPDDSTVSIMRARLLNGVNNYSNSTIRLSNELVDQRYTDFFSDLSEVSDRDRAVFSRVMPILANFEFDNSTDIRIIARNRSSIWRSKVVKKLFGGFGFLLGAASGYTYYTLAESASELFCKWAEIDDPETRNIIKQTVASMSVIPWGALGAEGAMQAFEALHTWLFKTSTRLSCPQTHSTARKVAAGLSVFEGASAAISITYLAIQATENMSWAARTFLIMSTFLGPTCVRTRAMNNLANHFIDWTDTFSSVSSTMRKRELVDAYDKIGSLIAELPEEDVRNLYGIFNNDIPLYTEQEENTLQQGFSR